jgi:serine phosphatase RsbU (regulator of sigma subunit)/anti-sigma regulatory factor (Ser/Thr protein kinase)
MVVTEDGRALKAIAADATTSRRATSDDWSLVPTEGPSLTAQAFRTQEPIVVARSEAPPGSAFAAVLDDEALDTVVFLPLVAGAQSVGVLDLGWRDGEHEIDEAELEHLGRLGTMFAEALARSIAAEFQRSVVATFQRALVPEEAYAATLDVAARYEPAEDLVTVGGDWFDVFDLDEHRMGLAVGDVVGNGIGAAAVMGRLRSALRAITLVVGDPGVALDQLDRFAADVRGALGTTVVLAVFDRRDGTLRYANAGHPPPVLFRGGRADLLDAARSRPLGIELAGAAPRVAAEVALGPGDLFVAYSDGLVERRTEVIDAGIERLRAAVAAGHADPIEDLADALLADVGGVGQRTDDTVLLCARPADPASAHFSARVMADPTELALLRERLGAWFRERGVAEGVLEDVVLAVSEAVANSMEHAYGLDDAESVVVGAAVPGPIVVTVRDRGPWRPSLERSERGRGIRLMRSLMDEIEFSTSASGTLVRMTKSQPAS